MEPPKIKGENSRKQEQRFQGTAGVQLSGRGYA